MTHMQKSCVSTFLSTLSLRRATEPQSEIIAYDNDFYPRSPCGERQRANSFADAPPHISIHALLAESDVNDAINGCNSDFISIHALLAESDVMCALKLADAMLFLSTLSLRRATSADCSCRNVRPISIHALLAESDQVTQTCTAKISDFYPRSPCGERLAVGR